MGALRLGFFRLLHGMGCKKEEGSELAEGGLFLVS